MRFDTPIYFQTIVIGEYDPETGNYLDDRIEENQVYADVSSISEQSALLIYGKVKTESLTVRIQNSYDKPFNYIRIGNTIFGVDAKKRYRYKTVFFISEVKKNET